MFMNSSRALLLAALMTVTAPVFMFASESGNVQGQQQNIPTTPPTAEPSVFSKIGSGAWSIVTWPFITALFTAPDFIAQNSLHKIADMGLFKDGKIAAVLKHNLTGRLAVYGVALYLGLKINEIRKQMQNESADEQQLLFEDENGI